MYSIRIFFFSDDGFIAVLHIRVSTFVLFGADDSGISEMLRSVDYMTLQYHSKYYMDKRELTCDKFLHSTFIILICKRPELNCGTVSNYAVSLSAIFVIGSG